MRKNRSQVLMCPGIFSKETLPSPLCYPNAGVCLPITQAPARLRWTSPILQLSRTSVRLCQVETLHSLVAALCFFPSPANLMPCGSHLRNDEKELSTTQNPRPGLRIPKAQEGAGGSVPRFKKAGADENNSCIIYLPCHESALAYQSVKRELFLD